METKTCFCLGPSLDNLAETQMKLQKHLAVLLGTVLNFVV